MTEKTSFKEIIVNEEMKELVIARINAQVPSNLKLAVGGYGTMNKEEMVKHVGKGDEIGKQIVKKHILFLRSLASGEFTRAIASVE